ncbi:MAG: M20/M25/M40 family metallo-hydrolase [Bacteroidota bacterium]
MRAFSLFYLFVTLGFLACGPNSPNRGQHSDSDSSAQIHLNAVFREIDREVREHSQAYPTLKQAIETIGHRLTGSPQGAQAEAVVYDYLKENQLPEVEYFGFSVEAWSRIAVRFWVSANIGAGWEVLPTVSLAHSPVRYSGEATIIDVRNGLREDFEVQKAAIPGNFVLMNLRLDGSQKPDSKNLHRTEKTALAREYGAGGVIFANAVDGNVLLTGAASVTGAVLPIPAICIGKETAEALRIRLAAGNVRGKIELENRAGEIEARNVIARIPGRELPAEKIIIGGHLDSWDLSTGAIDNGIGAFAVVEIARIFQHLHLRPRRTVEFVLFMGEEQGLLGSKAYVKHLETSGKLDQVKYLFNLDMTGNPIGFRSMGRKEAESWLTKVGTMIFAIDSSFENHIRTQAGLHSDHQPFMLKGIPVLGFQSALSPGVYNFYHSDGDNLELVNPEHLNRTVSRVGMVLYAMAETEKLPAERMDSEATRKFLIAQELKEKLVLGQEWEWKNGSNAD